MAHPEFIVVVGHLSLQQKKRDIIALNVA